MGNNKLISQTGFTLFVLAIVVVVLAVIAPLSGAAVWVIGVLALLSASLGFVAFKTPQGKIAAIGGALLLLAVLFLLPTASTFSR